jgi:large subunit ribosomal protein L21
VTFDQVLMVGNGDAVTVGSPLVAGALVAGHLVETAQEKTVIVFKKRRRHNSRRRNGHRQFLSTIRITEILTGGAKVTTTPDQAMKDRAAAKIARNAAMHARPVQAVSGLALTMAKVEAPASKPAKAAKAEKPVVEAAPVEAKAKAAPKAKKEAVEFTDDIKLIGGVGPVLEKKLHAAGITSLKDIAAWKKADIARFDEELDLRGRAERDEWVQQAKDLVAGKPPRAKVDQDASADKAKK